MRVRLYGKPDCSLCDKLKADLVVMQPEVGFELEEYNIEQDAAMYNQYRYLIPVLDIEDGELLYPPHTFHGVYQALCAAAQRTQK
ncbi:MAG: glutaredoxin [Chloroflexi bacterium]|nr:MAG: glutaredoxin [Chloroflexota bacterium]